jgi:hypothetical protein
MPRENADSVPLPVATCVICGWPMDGTVGVLEVHIGTAVYSACAAECPPSDVDRLSAPARVGYAQRRYRAALAQVRREAKKILATRGEAGGSLTSLERLQLEWQLITWDDVVEVDPSAASGLSAPEVVRRERDRRRQDGERA